MPRQKKGLQAYGRQVHSQRDELVKAHLGLVKKIVLHMASFLGSNVSRDDLLQVGMLGLLDAASRYDQSRKIPFEQFAKTRIRGAVIDELRKWDWRSRTDRENGQQIRDALQTLHIRFGRSPSESEIAAELGVSMERYNRMLQGSSPDSLLSLDTLLGNGGDGAILDVGDDDSVEVVTSNGERKQALVKALESLPEREQQLMSLYYVHEMNMQEIGEILSLTEARICQLHRQSLLRLRTLMEEWRDIR